MRTLFLDVTVPTAPDVHALAVADGVISACFDAAMVDRTGYDEVVDAHGATLLPAFGDGHAHPVFGSLEDGFAPVRAATSVTEIVAVMAEYAQDHPELEWLQGWGYDPTLAPQGVFRAQWLDDAVPDRPVVLRALDYHTAWCNSAALRAAGIDASTPDPPDGQIVRDPSGAPVGTLRERGATRAVFNLLPPLDLTTRVEAIQRSVARYAAAGVTWVQDAWVEPADIDAYAAWAVMDHDEPDERADLRFNLALLIEPETWQEARPRLAATRERVAALGVDRLTANTVKFFADGVIESGTAALLAPYTPSAADRPGQDPCGAPNWDPGELGRGRHRAGRGRVPGAHPRHRRRRRPLRARRHRTRRRRGTRHATGGRSSPTSRSSTRPTSNGSRNSASSPTSSRCGRSGTRSSAS